MTEPFRPVFAVIFALSKKGMPTTEFYPGIGVAGMTVGSVSMGSPINGNPFCRFIVILFRRDANRDVGVLRIDLLGDKTSVYPNFTDYAYGAEPAEQIMQPVHYIRSPDGRWKPGNTKTSQFGNCHLVKTWLEKRWKLGFYEGHSHQRTC
ncbi:MAG: hypothetical protein WD669_03420 [Pirellulales bacterium]